MYSVIVECKYKNGEVAMRQEKAVKGLQDLHERMDTPYKIIEIKDERGNRVYMKDFPL